MRLPQGADKVLWIAGLGAAAIYLLPKLGASLMNSGISSVNNSISAATKGWFYVNQGLQYYRAAGSTGLAGYKPFEWPSPEEYQRWLNTYNLPPLSFTIHANERNPRNGRACNGSINRGMSFAYIDTIHSRLTIDPRAGFSLAMLMQVADIDCLKHLGAGTPQTTKGNDPSHEYGYAIEVVDDFQMNSLVEAAKKLEMQLAWISKTGVVTKNGKKSWPLFQLRNGVKIRVGWSSQDHSSHFHVILPRPNWALGACTVS